MILKLANLFSQPIDLDSFEFMTLNQNERGFHDSPPPSHHPFPPSSHYLPPHRPPQSQSHQNDSSPVPTASYNSPARSPSPPSHTNARPKTYSLSRSYWWRLIDYKKFTDDGIFFVAVALEDEVVGLLVFGVGIVLGMPGILQGVEALFEDFVHDFIGLL